MSDVADFARDQLGVELEPWQIRMVDAWSNGIQPAALLSLPRTWSHLPAGAAHVCPECEQGKHDNCNGDAWDDQADELTSCDCAGRGHTS